MVCEYCGKSFRTMDGLRQHKKPVHPVEFAAEEAKRKFEKEKKMMLRKAYKKKNPETQFKIRQSLEQQGLDFQKALEAEQDLGKSFNAEETMQMCNTDQQMNSNTVMGNDGIPVRKGPIYPDTQASKALRDSHTIDLQPKSGIYW